MLRYYFQDLDLFFGNCCLDSVEYGVFKSLPRVYIFILSLKGLLINRGFLLNKLLAQTLK